MYIPQRIPFSLTPAFLVEVCDEHFIICYCSLPSSPWCTYTCAIPKYEYTNSLQILKYVVWNIHTKETGIITETHRLVWISVEWLLMIRHCQSGHAGLLTLIECRARAPHSMSIYMLFFELTLNLSVLKTYQKQNLLPKRCNKYFKFRI